MEIGASKRVNSLGFLTNHNLIFGLQNPKTIGFSLIELKTELHSRVKNRLFQYCNRLCARNRFDDSIAKDLFQQTLLKALMNINEFEIKSQISDERISNSFFAWLNTIAHNLYMDFLKERSKTLYSDCSYEELECEEPRPDDFEFEIDQNTDILLQEAWDSLDEREKYIVNICIKYNCLDNKNHLPDNEIKEICKELFIEKGHIRVIKFRALKKLQKIRKVHEKSK